MNTPAPNTTSKISILPLELKGVCFEAGGNRLIKNASWRFEANKKTAIIGANGAGKSLLLRLCHGLIKPSQGEVHWHIKNDAARYQAMVFQRPVMLRRSVAANINFALKLRRIPRHERTKTIYRVLSATGLKRLADQPARVLSIGEQQKLALARAWALKPQVLFLDEPTASLDPTATHSIEKIIAAIHAQGTRIIMTTHDLGQARRIADEVIFMNRGRILEAGDAKAFFKKQKNDLAQAFVRGELLWGDMELKDHKTQYE
jgi:tungstate transport system ATP-binding protein